MKDWYQYRPWTFTHRAQLRESRHMTYHTTASYYQIAAAQWRMVHFGIPKVGPIHTQILDPSMKDWYQYRPLTFTHRAQLRESRHMTYHTTASYYQIAAAQWRMIHLGIPRVGPIQTQILDPSMKDWYQYRRWNLNHRIPLRKSTHMTYHTTALLPNSCGPIWDGPFRDGKGRSYPHPKYWTHRWRIDINNGHEISPIETI